MSWKVNFGQQTGKPKSSTFKMPHRRKVNFESFLQNRSKRRSFRLSRFLTKVNFPTQLLNFFKLFAILNCYFSIHVHPGIRLMQKVNSSSPPPPTHTMISCLLGCNLAIFGVISLFDFTILIKCRCIKVASKNTEMA